MTSERWTRDTLNGDGRRKLSIASGGKRVVRRSGDISERVEGGLRACLGDLMLYCLNDRRVGDGEAASRGVFAVDDEAEVVFGGDGDKNKKLGGQGSTSTGCPHVVLAKGDAVD